MALRRRGIKNLIDKVWVKMYYYWEEGSIIKGRLGDKMHRSHSHGGEGGE